MREVLVDAISDEGYTTVSAATGDEAVGLLEVSDLRMVVTDINLPGQRDGIEVAVVARRTHPGIPVLFISGRHWLLAEAEKLGPPAGFLKKPFSLTALIRDMDRLMAFAQTQSGKGGALLC